MNRILANDGMEASAREALEQSGYEVHTITVNTGGFDEKEVKEIETRAKNLGVASHKTVDETKNYYDKVIRYLIYGNILKNNT